MGAGWGAAVQEEEEGRSNCRAGNGPTKFLVQFFHTRNEKSDPATPYELLGSTLFIQPFT